MALPEETRSTGGLRIELEGDLTIERANEVRKVLLEAFADGNPGVTIDVHLDRIGKIDLFGIQMLYSVSCFGKKLNREVTFSGSPKTLTDLALAAGLESRFVVTDGMLTVK